MSSFRRPTNTNSGDTVLYGGEDMHVITDMLNGSTNTIPPVKFKTLNGVTFWDGVLRFTDTSNESFILTIKNPTSLTASRQLTLPSIAVNDTLTANNLTQTLTNKTFNTTDNSLTATSAVSGEILVHNGTKFVRLPLGTSVQFLRGDGVWATAPGQGGGEANTMTNIGTAGVGVYKQKTGMQFEMKKITGASGVTVTDNTTDNQIDLTVNTAGILLQNLGGTLTVAKGGTGVATFTAGLLVGNGTSNITSVTAPSGAVVGTTDTQTLTGKTINATNNTITDTSTAAGDILKGNGTKFVRLGRGTAGQVLKVNAGGTDVEWGTDSGAGGSGNTTTLFKNTTSSAAVSTSSETNILNHSITGGTIGINGILHVYVAGYYKNDSGADDQFDIRLKLGGTTLWQDSSGTMTDDTDVHPFYLDLWIKNMNSASVQRVTGFVSHGNAEAGDVGFSDLSQDDIRGNGPIYATGAINTGSTQSLVLSIDHADSSSDISFNADIVFVELVTS